MKITNFKAALFDLDGVIVDTEPRYSIFWGGMGRKHNVQVDDFANVIKGTTLTQILDRYFPGEETQRSVVADLNNYEREMQYDIFPDVIPFLEYLKANNVPCAVVTSSNCEKMANLWAQHPTLRDYFDAVITDENVTHSKPDPEPFLLAADALGVNSNDAIVFEDSFNGLLSGRRAGCTVVALATTNPAEKLREYADMVIDNFAALLKKND